MKTGCCVWNYGAQYGAASHMDFAFEDAIERIGKNGFQGLELIAFQRRTLDQYYTKSRIRKLRALLSSYKLEISQFVSTPGDPYQTPPPPNSLASLNEEERKAGIEHFRRASEVAAELGTKIVDTLSYPPPKVEIPRNYFREPGVGVKIGSGFSWKRIWETYIQTIGTCADIAKGFGLKYTIEKHMGDIVGTSDAYLRLFEAVGSPTLGANLDLGFCMGEIPEVCIYKLGEKVMHVHARDVREGSMIDYHGIITALKNIGYKGFLSIEGIGRVGEKYTLTDVDRLHEEARKYLEKHLSELGVKDC